MYMPAHACALYMKSTLKNNALYLLYYNVDLFLLDVSCSPGEIELRLSQLPPWAQKQMLSRPSVAQSVSSATAAASSAGGRGGGPAATAAIGETAAPLEGKWAQVSE